MSKRKKYDARCRRCLMREELCLCAKIPRLELASRLILVITRRELQVPSNTGRLAALALPNSVVLVRGDPTLSCDTAAAQQSMLPSYLLYPADDAELLSPKRARAIGPINLVVPDGNWRQTAKMRRRDPFLASLPCLRLPPLGPSAYRIRREAKAEGLATLEAIAQTLGLIEGPEVQHALEELLDEMVSCILRSRGLVYDAGASQGQRRAGSSAETPA